MADKPKTTPQPKKLTESEKLTREIIAFREKLKAAKGTSKYSALLKQYRKMVEDRDAL